MIISDLFCFGKQLGEPISAASFEAVTSGVFVIECFDVTC